jgi:ketosteroid isomerase-like protein
MERDRGNPVGEWAMSEESTRAAVIDLYAAYARGDGERMAALIDDDVDFVIHAPPQVLPFAGHHQGKGAVLEALGRIAKDYLLESYVPQVTVVDGDHAAVMSDVAFTQRSSGRTLRFHIADFLRFRDGRLVEFREFMNTFEVVQQVLDRQLAV